MLPNVSTVVVTVILEMKNKNTNLFYLLLLGAIVSAHCQDVQQLVNDAGMSSIGEITLNEETFLMHIVPSSMMSKKLYKLQINLLSDVFSNDNEDYMKFIHYVDQGYTMKGLTFNIYDDNMREATVTLFRMICNLDSENFNIVKEWAKQNINDHMFDYAERLCTLYAPKTNNFKWKVNEPPFLVTPNFYVNSETIMKALKLKSSNTQINYQKAKVNQYYKNKKFGTINTVINTNFSGWNKPNLHECQETIDYFTEDISLNSYNYGLHLLHPFWMSNNELDEINSRHAEHYHFSHQQLLARYQLEKESMRQRNISRSEMCDDNFNSYLIYDNGLSFPIRSNILGDWNQDKTKLKGIDIGIKEFISRGFFYMENGTKFVNLTADNYIGLISKILRANYENSETAKIVRSLYGYGNNGYPTERYNPAPSLLHQPETALRDPAYWILIQYMLQYFTEFEHMLEPLDLSLYETNDFVITDANITRLTTFFDYYQFVIDKTTESDDEFSTVLITARQRRLSHLPISFNFTVMSKHTQDVVVRLFLGPQCAHDNCWEHHNKFCLLDAWNAVLESGKNFISWSPGSSHKLSSDGAFNKEDRSSRPDLESYNMFKFPENLLLPKGLEEGLNMTLFIMITRLDDASVSPITEGSSYYNVIYYEVDEKPLGFPFHRHATNYRDVADNYRFYNVTIFHKKSPLDGSGYFSPHLY